MMYIVLVYYYYYYYYYLIRPSHYIHEVNFDVGFVGSTLLQGGVTSEW